MKFVIIVEKKTPGKMKRGPNGDEVATWNWKTIERHDGYSVDGLPGIKDAVKEYRMVWPEEQGYNIRAYEMIHLDV